MYEVIRKDGRVFIYDWNGKIVYNVKEDSKMIYRREIGDLQIEAPGKMTDDQLLYALATAVKLAL